MNINDAWILATGRLTIDDDDEEKERRKIKKKVIIDFLFCVV